MPVRGVRLHEHPDVRAAFFRYQSTIATDLHIRVNEGDGTEAEQGPHGPRQPGTGSCARHLVPPIVDPTHRRTHPPAYITALNGMKIRWRTRWSTTIHPSVFATARD